MKYVVIVLVALASLGAWVGVALVDDDEKIVHVPGYSPECAAEFAAYWRAEGLDADAATHNAGLKRVREACDGWPWPILDALLYAGHLPEFSELREASGVSEHFPTTPEDES